MTRFAGATKRCGSKLAALVLLTTSACSSSGSDTGFRLEVSPAEGTFNKPAAIIVNAYLSGSASYTAEGATTPAMARAQAVPGSGNRNRPG